MNFPNFKNIVFESTWIIIKMEIRTIEICIKIKKKKFLNVQIKRINKLLVPGLKCISEEKEEFLRKYRILFANKRTHGPWGLCKSHIKLLPQTECFHYPICHTNPAQIYDTHQTTKKYLENINSLILRSATDQLYVSENCFCLQW